MGQLFCCGKVNNNHQNSNQSIMQLNRFKINIKNVLLNGI